MCIICRVDSPSCRAGSDFLTAFEKAQRAMRQATEAMLACRNLDKFYDPTHKRMAKLCRDWNRIEQQREADITTTKVL